MADTVPAVFLAQARALGAASALRVHGDAHAPLSWAGWAAASAACARALIADGFGAGEPAAILAGNGLLWPIADMGTLAAGMLSVGVFPSSAPTQVAAILRDAGATIVFVDSPARLASVADAAATLPALRRIVVGVPFGAPPAAAAVPALAPPPSPVLAPASSAGPVAAVAGNGSGPLILSWDAWLARAESAPDAALSARLAGLRADDPAVVIYTSGSTGEPKGALLSHRYLLASAASIGAAFGLAAGGRMLSFLPFSHAAERVFGQMTRIVRGTEAVLVADPREVWAAARAHEPTTFGGLPRYYEKIHEQLHATRAALTGDAAAAWDRALALGRHRSALRRRGETVPAALEAEWQRARAPLAACIASKLGARVAIATSGGATLPVRVAAELDAAGLTVLGAYGLTEHLCVAAQRPDRYAFGTVGVAMPGTELRVDDGGEVLVRRGELTFSGYLGRPADTAAAFTPDGEWLRTGDLGELDADGTLRITGRRKELIALSTGRKIAPAPIEARLVEHPLIGNAVLFGEGRKYVTALLALRPAAVARWALEHGRTTSPAELLRDPALLAELGAAIEAVNASLSPQERVCRYALLDRELTHVDGELTPTLKVRRDVVAALYGTRVDALYAEAT